MDAIKLLKQDHEKVKKILSELNETGEKAVKTRTTLFAKLNRELTIHEIIEEEILYPALEEQAKLKDIVLEGYQEHHVVDLILGELSELSPEDEKWVRSCRSPRRMWSITSKKKKARCSRKCGNSSTSRNSTS